MFVDLLDRPPRTSVEADICIVGAGAAGITIARELLGHPVSVALLESGGLEREVDAQALYCGESVGLKYGPLEETRVRYFGGSTNPEGWGGWCKPFDEIDFEKRSWLEYGGWPFSRSELEPWYWRAQALCEAGPFDYDLESWRRHIETPLDELPLGRDSVVTELAQLSPPTRFGQRYRDELAAARNVCVYLHANAMEVVTDRDGSTAKCVEAVTLKGQRLTVASRFVVLAAGGLENARLLLASPGATAGGLGNENDLVGRFFMEHPRLEIGSVELAGGVLSDLYDPYFKYRHRVRSLRGVYDESLIAGSLALAPEIQRSERLLNFRTWIVPVYPGYGSPADAALKRLYIALRERTLSATARRDLMAVLRRPDHTLTTAIGRLLRPKRLISRYQLVNIFESPALPESRVTLGEAVDPLGMRKIRIDWHLGKLARRTLAVAHEVLNDELRRTGTGKLVEPYQLGDERLFKDRLQWAWHHMGTTRMHNDPACGVVDADCRVHSTSNVYVAGSSVFPTPGNDMPTLTIVALASRLAEHLAGRLEAPAL